MIIQYGLIDISEYDWIIALGIIVGMSFFLTIFLSKSFKTFFLFALILSGFCYYGNLIDLWIVISLIIVNVLIMFIHLRSGSGLIMTSLGLMFILVVFNIMLGGDYISTTTSLVIDNEALIDGVSSTFQLQSDNFMFEIDSLQGLIILITTIIAIAVLVGTQVLGSGLSDNSVRTITIASIFSGIWIILSVIVAPLIWSIEVFGSLIYILLTISYSIGVVQKVIS